MDEIGVTKNSNVYGIAMVAYEASSTVSGNPRVKSHVNLLGLEGERALL